MMENLNISDYENRATWGKSKPLFSLCLSLGLARLLLSIFTIYWFILIWAGTTYTPTYFWDMSPFRQIISFSDAEISSVFAWLMFTFLESFMALGLSLTFIAGLNILIRSTQIGLVNYRSEQREIAGEEDRIKKLELKKELRNNKPSECDGETLLVGALIGLLFGFWLF